MKQTPQYPYIVPVLTKALDILELLQADNCQLTLEGVHRQTGIPRSTVYSVLRTFVHRGYLSQSRDGCYSKVTRSKKVYFGFGWQSSDMPFYIEVTDGLETAAATCGIDLLILDNKYDGFTAIENANQFVAKRVDLVIECLVEEDVAPIVADVIVTAGIPLIAIEVPHPHATFIGLNNYRAGFDAGELLARYSVEYWRGEVTCVIGLDLPEAGSAVQSRITGCFEGMRRSINGLADDRFVRLNGRGKRDVSRTLVYDFLVCNPKDRRILIGAVTDSSALGALDAIRALKRERHVAVVGQECVLEALVELNDEKSPLIGSISHEGKAYGEKLVDLGVSLLRGQIVPPYNYIAHRLVTRCDLFESALK